MGLKTLLLLAAFLASITVGTAIKCYVCAGSDTSDCAKGKGTSMAVANCKNPGVNFTHRSYTYLHSSDDNKPSNDLKPVCLKLTETDFEPKLFIRSCGLFPSNVDPCEFLEQQSHVINCKACKTDFCNQRAELQEDSSLFNIIED